MQVQCMISEATITNDDGLEVEGVIATCSRCERQKESFGTGEASRKRCLALLRENCPRDEKNFYIEENGMMPSVRDNNDIEHRVAVRTAGAVGDFTPDDNQARVIREARAWLKDPNGEQVKYLAGYAGVGKTSVARCLVEGFEARFAAPTGKAAAVLRSKQCDGATTLHRLMYRPHEVLGRDAGGVTRSVGFSICPDSELGLGGIDVVVADECSMISETVARDLLSFGIKVLVLGDPFQLPPVSGRGAFADVPPSWLLTEIHRQAKESGILRLATDVREGRGVDSRPGAYGNDVAVIGQDELGNVDPKEILHAVDQILVGKNATRHALNKWARQAKGLAGEPKPEYPTVGDKLVCLRNDHQNGFMNGGQWMVKRAKYRRGTSYDAPCMALTLESLDEPGVVTDTTAWVNHFDGTGDALKRLHWKALKEHQEFDVSYAVTTHRYQGSQADNILVLDESAVFGQDAARHLYTSVTRSAKTLILVQ